MAYQLEVDCFGVTFAAAYHRVVAVEIDQASAHAMITTAVYANAQARKNNQRPLDLVSYHIYDAPEDTAFTKYFGVETQSADGMNPIKASYAYLATLGSYAEAVEV